jgi:DNA-binding NarL/FixJ family response regulator
MYTVLLLATDPFARAELGSFLSAQDVVIFTGFAPSDDFSEFLSEVDAVIWEIDEQDALSLNPAGFEVPLLALVRAPEEAAHALRYGAVGVVNRTVSAEQLLSVLETLVQGFVGLEPAFLMHSPTDDMPFETLTPREQSMLELLGEGMSNKTIAKQLEISDHTVKFHLNSTLSKLGATSRTEAVTKAVRAGVLRL